MQSDEPSFDIFKGFPDRDAIWIERVPGLAAARERMGQIAARDPGQYFVFSPASHDVLATHAEPPRRLPAKYGYDIFRTLADGCTLKVAWRREQKQAEELLSKLAESWPAEYFIQAAKNEPDSDTHLPAVSA